MAEAPGRLGQAIEIGAGLPPLQYLLARGARPARWLRVRRFGRTAIAAAASVEGARGVLLPPSRRFARLDAAGIAGLVGLAQGARAPRAVAVQAAADGALGARLVAEAGAEVAVWPAGYPAPEGFGARAADGMTAALGLGGHRLLARPGFAGDLEAMLVRADAARRRALACPVAVHGIEDLVLAEGCWPVESDGGASWAWTGPQRMATILLPPLPPGPRRITLFLYGARVPLARESLRVTIDGQAAEARYADGEAKIECRVASSPPAPCQVLRIFHARLGATADGSRLIGVALHKVKCEVLPCAS
jgi:hypothetical protein